VAARLEPAGALEILDVRQSFLDQTVRRARRRGLTNVVPKLGDGKSLPCPNSCFDAACLITVLGEIPDREAALGELRRVLKPAGRLVVGEILIDPDFTTLPWLVRHARAAGLLLERRTGTQVGYFARFRAERNSDRPVTALDGWYGGASPANGGFGCNA
jgi:ubiquinone/menaquinone biosynthesis C-methylase UbiE